MPCGNPLLTFARYAAPQWLATGELHPREKTTMRYLTTLTMSACCLLATAAVQAQDNEKGQKAMQMLNQKFDTADSNHDGKLSPDEAKAGMPHISEHFGEIDSNKDGYVSKAEIVSAMAAMKAKRDADHAQ
jgi:hypothetical protein